MVDSFVSTIAAEKIFLLANLLRVKSKEWTSSSSNINENLFLPGQLAGDFEGSMLTPISCRKALTMQENKIVELFLERVG